MFQKVATIPNGMEIGEEDEYRWLTRRSDTLSVFVPRLTTLTFWILGISLNRMNPRVSGSATSLRRLWTEYKQLTSGGLSYEIALNLIDTI
jgi:hypothetical protein